MTKAATVQCLNDIKAEMKDALSASERTVLFTYIDKLAKSVSAGADMNLAAVEHNLLRLRKELYESRRANLDQEVRVEADRVKRAQIADPILRVESLKADAERVAAAMDAEGRRVVESFHKVFDWMAPARQALGIEWLWDIDRKYIDERGRMWARAVAGQPAPNTPDFVLSAAEQYKQWVGEAFDELKLEGVETKKLPYRIPHKWEPALVEANKDRFIELLTKRLSTKPEHHPNPEESAHAIYEGIIKSVGPSDPDFRIKTTREVFFDNIDDEINMLEEFGSSSWAEMFAQDLVELSNKRVLASEFGAKSLDTFEQMLDVTVGDAKKELIDTSMQHKLDSDKKNIELMIRHMAGELEGVHNQTVASVSKGLRVGLGAVLLQRSVLFSIMDLSTRTSYSAEMMHHVVPGLVAPDGSPMVQRNSGMSTYIKELMANFSRFKDMVSDSEFRRVIDKYGTIESVSLGQTLNRYAPESGPMTAARMSKIGKAQRFEAGAQRFANKMMRGQGATAMMQQSQRGAALSLGGMLGEYHEAGVTWADFKKLSPEMATQMENAGFDAAKWNAAVLNGNLVEIRGHKFILPHDNVDVRNREGVAARRALMAWVQMQSRLMVVAPDLETRAKIAAFTNADGRGAGSFTGEVARFGVQFMSFQIAAFKNVSVHMYRTKGAMALGRVAVSTMMAAMAITQIQQWLSSGKMYDPSGGRGLSMWLAQSANTTGMAWIAGSALQAGVSAQLLGTSLDSSSSGNFVGPAPETALGLVKDVFVNPALDIAQDGELADATKRHLILTPARLVPVVNMPFFSHWWNSALRDFATDVDPRYGKMIDKRDHLLGRELWEE